MSTYKYKDAGNIVCKASAEIRVQSHHLFLLLEDFDESKAMLDPSSRDAQRLNELLEHLMDITAALDIIGQEIRNTQRAILPKPRR